MMGNTASFRRSSEEKHLDRYAKVLSFRLLKNLATVTAAFHLRSSLTLSTICLHFFFATMRRKNLVRRRAAASWIFFMRLDAFVRDTRLSPGIGARSKNDASSHNSSCNTAGRMTNFGFPH